TNAPPAASGTTPSLWLFEDVDFKDAAAFTLRLKAGQDSFSAYLFGRLSDETKRLLSAFPGGQISKELLQSLIHDLSTILPTPTLYQDTRDFFANVTLKAA